MVTKVSYRWDDQFGVEPGWFVETWDGCEFADDSQKVWFPVAVDQFDRDQEQDLVAALREAFPGADIEA